MYFWLSRIDGITGCFKGWNGVTMDISKNTISNISSLFETLGIVLGIVTANMINIGVPIGVSMCH